MPGGLDANGIYIYTETDVAGAAGGGTFSGLLNKLATSITNLLGGSGGILQRLTALELAATLVLSTNIAAGTGAGVIVTYDATDIANTLAGAFTITRSTGKLVATGAATWEITVDATFATAAAGGRGVYLSKALAAAPTVFTIISSQNSGAPGVGGVPAAIYGRWIITLAAGDVITIGAIQSSGGTINLTGAHLRLKRLA